MSWDSFHGVHCLWAEIRNCVLSFLRTNQGNEENMLTQHDLSQNFDNKINAWKKKGPKSWWKCMCLQHVEVLNPIVLSNNLVADHFVRSWKLSSFWQESRSRLDSIVAAKKTVQPSNHMSHTMFLIKHSLLCLSSFLFQGPTNSPC